MRVYSRSAVLLLLGALCLAAVCSCVKTVERTRSGPGGLPTGVVHEGETPAGDHDLPVYPGATRRATNVYQTPDGIEKVKAYYVDLLGVEPEVRDSAGDALTFSMPNFKLVLLRMPSSGGGGTEISFYSPPET